MREPTGPRFFADFFATFFFATFFFPAFLFFVAMNDSFGLVTDSLLHAQPPLMHDCRP
jgi:hypothetical protein